VSRARFRTVGRVARNAGRPRFRRPARADSLAQPIVGHRHGPAVQKSLRPGRVLLPTPLANDARRRRSSPVTLDLAGRATEGLAEVGAPRADGGRTLGRPAFDRAGCPLRRTPLDHADHRRTRLGIQHPPPRPSQKRFRPPLILAGAPSPRRPCRKRSQNAVRQNIFRPARVTRSTPAVHRLYNVITIAQQRRLDDAS